MVPPVTCQLEPEFAVAGAYASYLNRGWQRQRQLNLNSTPTRNSSSSRGLHIRERKKQHSVVQVCLLLSRSQPPIPYDSRMPAG